MMFEEVIIPYSNGKAASYVAGKRHIPTSSLSLPENVALFISQNRQRGFIRFNLILKIDGEVWEVKDAILTELIRVSNDNIMLNYDVEGYGHVRLKCRR